MSEEQNGFLRHILSTSCSVDKVNMTEVSSVSKGSNITKCCGFCYQRNQSVSTCLRLRCHICGIRLHDKYLSVGHYLTEHKTFYTKCKYKCPVCNELFGAACDVNEHCASVDGRSVLKVDCNYRCKFSECKFETKNIINYQFHFICHYAFKEPFERINRHVGIFAKINSSSHFCMTCKICKKKILKTSQLNHYLANHRLIFSYRCFHCFLLFNNILELRNHCSSIHKDHIMKFVQCAYMGCSFNEKKLSRYIEHCLVSHSFILETFTCICCFFQTESQESLNNHKYFCKIVVIPCRHCNYVSTQSTDIVNHYHVNHAKLIDSIRFGCHYCKLYNFTSEEMKIHFAYIHKNLTEFYCCAECDFATDDINIYQYHKVFFHFPFNNNVTIEENFTCDYCLFQADDNNIMITHKLKCKSDINCLHCEFKTVTKKNMLRHYQQSHKDIIKLIQFKVHFQSKPDKEKVKLYICSKCIFATPSDEDYLFHNIFAHQYNSKIAKIDKKHSIDNNSMCRYCYSEITPFYQLQTHELECASIKVKIKINETSIAVKSETDVGSQTDHIATDHSTKTEDLVQTKKIEAKDHVTLGNTEVATKSNNTDSTEIKNVEKVIQEKIEKNNSGDRSRITTLSCKYCIFHAEDNDQLVRHELDCKTTVVECKLCNYKYAGKTAVVAHYLLAHHRTLNSIKYKCSYCPNSKIFNKQGLKDHCVIAHSKIDLDQLNCQKCTFNTKSIVDYQFHNIMEHRLHDTTDKLKKRVNQNDTLKVSSKKIKTEDYCMNQKGENHMQVNADDRTLIDISPLKTEDNIKIEDDFALIREKLIAKLDTENYFGLLNPNSSVKNENGESIKTEIDIADNNLLIGIAQDDDRREVNSDDRAIIVDIAFNTEVKIETEDDVFQEEQIKKFN